MQEAAGRLGGDRAKLATSSRRKARCASPSLLKATGLVAAAFGPRLAAGWRWSGAVPALGCGRFYIGKFCFDYASRDDKAGRFSFTMSGEVQPLQEVSMEGGSEGMSGLFFAVFDDELDSWKKSVSLYGASNDGSSASCEDLLRYQHYYVQVPPQAHSFNRTVYITESVRPRFWYFTFVACNISIVTPLQYQIHAQNIKQGIQSEFSLDERGTLPLQLFATVFFGLLAYALRVCVIRAEGTEAFRSRPLLRLLLFSACMSTAGASCNLLHCAVFMADGVGWPFFEMLGQLELCCAKAVFSILQLLVAKGWALFYSPEEVARRRMVFCTLGLIVAISFGCEVNAQWFHDASTTLYLYESLPGTLILILNVVLFIEAYRSMLDTYRHETSDEVRYFYFLVSLVMWVYFMTLPLICVLAVSFDPWVRAKYVARAEVFSRLSATGVLAYCLRPTRLDAMINARLAEGLEPIGEFDDERFSNDGDEEHGQALLAKGIDDDLQDEPAE